MPAICFQGMSGRRRLVGELLDCLADDLEFADHCVLPHPVD